MRKGTRYPASWEPVSWLRGETRWGLAGDCGASLGGAAGRESPRRGRGRPQRRLERADGTRPRGRSDHRLSGRRSNGTDRASKELARCARRRRTNSPVASCSICARSMASALNVQSKSSNSRTSWKQASPMRFSMLRSRRWRACVPISRCRNSRCDRDRCSAVWRTSSNCSPVKGTRSAAKSCRICSRRFAGTALGARAAVELSGFVVGRSVAARLRLVGIC